MKHKYICIKGTCWVHNNEHNMYNMMQKIYINEEKSEKVGDDNKYKNRGKMIKIDENIRK